MKSKEFNHIDFDKDGTKYPDKERLWEGIEPFLLTDNLYREENRELLLKTIEELPIIHPSISIWPSVSQTILVDRGTNRKKIFIRTVSGIAAMLIIAVLLKPIYKSNETVKIPVTTNAGQQCGEDLKVNEFLAQICSAYPGKCKNMDFLELKNEILKLQHEKSELQAQFFYNTEDETTHDLCARINEQINLLKNQMGAYVSL
jgi:hypothetical protein